MFLALAACVSDNRLAGAKPEVSSGESGHESTPLIDTGGLDTSPDETAGTDDACGDPTWPAEPLPTRADCGVEGAHPAWELVERWTDPGAGDAYAAPSLGHLTDDDGDGVVGAGDLPDLVYAPANEPVHAYVGADGSRLWRGSNTAEIEQTTPAVGDLDGDGRPEVVVGGHTETYALDGATGALLWEGAGPRSIKPYCGGIGIADFAGDASPEVYFGRLVLDGRTGVRRWEGDAGYGTAVPGESPMSVAADLDLDGRLELIVGNAVYDADGVTLWSGGDDGFPAVGQFDADPEGEIVVARPGTIALLNHDGTTIWDVDPGRTAFGPPVVADLDGDGDAEIAVPCLGGMLAFDADGTVLWNIHLSFASGLFDAATAYDLDGDGAWEILHAGSDAVEVIDGASGAILAEYTHATHSQCAQAPVVADLDGDGSVEIAISTYSGATGLVVLADRNGFTGGRPVWNQHDYSITNVTDESGIPTAPTPNWSVYNSFRAGEPQVSPLDANLVVRILNVCDAECADGRLVLWVSVGNDGVHDLTDEVRLEVVGVVAGEEIPLTTLTWTDPIPAGWRSASERVVLEGVPTPLDDVYVRVDMDDRVAECDETDDEDHWNAPICTTPP